MPDWTKSLKFCAYKVQESGRLQRLSEKVREDQRRPEKTREDQKLIARGSPPVLVN